MITVATKLEIPAKLLFPRPSRPGEDPAKQALSMLGLGDVVLPGIMIGLALRFDLYLFYLQKQKRKNSGEENNKVKKIEDDGSLDYEVTKAQWQPATGGWGERFWVGQVSHDTGTQQHGGSFPKTYFHASIVGYVSGMLCTLGFMHIYGHAQPALLYLVPGVLGSLWGTALVKGEVKTMWDFTEAEEEELANGEEDQKKAKGIDSFFSLSRQEKMAKRLEENIKKSHEDIVANENGTKKDKQTTKKTASDRHHSNKLISFSISSTPKSSEETSRESANTFPDQSTFPLEKENRTPNSNSPSMKDELRQASESIMEDHEKADNPGLRRREVSDS